MANKAKMSERGKKRFRIMIGIIILIIIGIIVIVNNNNKVNENSEEQLLETDLEEEYEQGEKAIVEEYVEVVNDGEKLNVSSTLKQEKTIDGLTITNIQLTSKNGVSQLLADVFNPTDSKAGDFPVLITALDKNGNEILQVHGYISSVAPGATTQLSSSITDDYANAYDFKVEKEK